MRPPSRDLKMRSTTSASCSIFPEWNFANRSRRFFVQLRCEISGLAPVMDFRPGAISAGPLAPARMVPGETKPASPRARAPGGFPQNPAILGWARGAAVASRPAPLQNENGCPKPPAASLFATTGPLPPHYSATARLNFRGRGNRMRPFRGVAAAAAVQPFFDKPVSDPESCAWRLRCSPPPERVRSQWPSAKPVFLRHAEVS
jgi:hypothetical protein